MIENWLEWFPDLMEGLKISVLLGLAVTAIGLVLGVGVAVASISTNRLVSYTSLSVVEILRGTPLLVLLYLAYFGLPEVGLTFGALSTATVAFGVNTSVYMGEIIRGGLLSIPQGEIEAANSLGLAWRHTMFKIVLPQALRIVFPSLVSYAIVVFQATSLCYLIGVQELLSRGFIIGSVTFEYLQVLTLVGLIYIIVSAVGSRLVHGLEEFSRREPQGSPRSVERSTNPTKESL